MAFPTRRSVLSGVIRPWVGLRILACGALAKGTVLFERSARERGAHRRQ
jgi:hypothetical protein